MSESLKFLTVLKSGGEYKASHVYALRDQVNRWIPEADFICLTDADLECETIELEKNLPGWWSKLELFKLEGPILYCDLDTTIVGSCDHWLEKIKVSKFAILRDVYRGKRNKHAMGSGIMYWSGDMTHVWEAYCQDGMPTDIPGGDQSYLEAVIRKAQYLQDFTDDVVSYKSDIRDGNYKVKDASIVYFHGKPRPWELKEPIGC